MPCVTQAICAGAIEAYRGRRSRWTHSHRVDSEDSGQPLGIAGQTDEALAVLGKAIEHEPDNALLWYEQALD